MSLYDLFVFFKSDDIDPITGDVDDSVFSFDEDDIQTKYNEIQSLVDGIQAQPGDISGCDDLLQAFHRTIEHSDVPEWHGGTVSQVCLAEGTTAYVKLDEAAAAAAGITNTAPMLDDFVKVLQQGINGDPQDPQTGSAWDFLDALFQDVSVGSDGTVVVYTMDCCALMLAPGSGDWTSFTDPNLVFAFQSISVVNKDIIYALVNEGSVRKMYRFSRNTWEFVVEVVSPRVQIAVASDERVWMLDGAGYILSHGVRGQGQVELISIRQGFSRIAVGNENKDLWAVKGTGHFEGNEQISDGTLYHADVSSGSGKDELEVFDGFRKYKSISAAFDGTVWAIVDESDPGNCCTMWRYDADKEFWQDMTGLLPGQRGYHRISFVAVGSRGNVWGLTGQDPKALHRYKSTVDDDAKAAVGRLSTIADALVKEVVGCAEALFYHPQAHGWTMEQYLPIDYPGIFMGKISVSKTDGTVWGIGSDPKKLYRQCERTEGVGSSCQYGWLEIPADYHLYHFQAVAVVNADEAWALNEDGRALHWTSSSGWKRFGLGTDEAFKFDITAYGLTSYGSGDAALVVALKDDYTVWQRTGEEIWEDDGGDWHQLSVPDLQSVSSESSQCFWGVGTDGNAYKFVSAGAGWTKTKFEHGRLKQISSASMTRVFVNKTPVKESDNDK